MNELLTIIVPIYNVEQYLNKSLSSIQNQSYSNFECLMINDGSTDLSEEICLGFSNNDKRFKYFYKENGGVSSARNYGLDNTSENSVYTAFFDPDDYIESDYYDLIIQAMKKYQTDIGCGRRVLVKEYSPISKLERSVDNPFTYHNGPSFFLWQHIFKTSLIKNNNIRFLPMSHYEDTVFVADACGFAKDTKIGYEETSYYIYTDKRHNSLCNTSAEKNKSRLLEALPMQIEHRYEITQNPTFSDQGVRLENLYIDNTKGLLKSQFCIDNNALDNLKFMVLGGNCYAMPLLSKQRIKGPVDNVLSLKGLKSSIMLLDKSYEHEILDMDPIIAKGNTIINQAPEIFNYPNFSIVHNDPRTDKYKEELKSRLNAFYQFLLDIDNNNNWLVYNLGQFDVESTEVNGRGDCTQKLLPNFIEGLELLKSYKTPKGEPLINKIIFIGNTHKNATLDYAKFYSESCKNLVPNYIEMCDIRIRPESVVHEIFISKLLALLNSK